MIKNAIVSPCGKYRYSLIRDWDDSKYRMTIIMLNPSVADSNIDDPTIRKCIGFAERLGYGGITVLNLFAFRATKPADLRIARQTNDDDYVYGPHNSKYIDLAFVLARQGKTPIYCAWGANARNTVAVESFLEYAKQWPTVNLMALRLLADGTPQHPLMLPYDLTPVPMKGYEL
jgi:hypothetical protein